MVFSVGRRSGTDLDHLTVFDLDGTELVRKKVTHTVSMRMAPQVIFGAGFPPVPRKLVKRIEDGEYIEMAELLPDKRI